MKVCPDCGGRSLLAQLLAVFRWDGSDQDVLASSLSSSEHPIDDLALAQCEDCDWSGWVRNLTQVPEGK